MFENRRVRHEHRLIERRVVFGRKEVWELGDKSVAAIASTPLVEAARARGLRAETGVTMLLHQGVRAFELFTGRPAPVEVMRAALLAALGAPPRAP